jgi:HD-GYP domain-containing protein (c-di-GMP phosphodiesterase class II)
MTSAPTIKERAGGRLAGGAAVLGTALLALLVVLQEVPQPWWLWGVLALVFVILEFAAVEIDDRLRISSSIMVTFTAVVVFGPDSAVLAVALMAALAMFQPEDFRRRRWMQPAYNFGQLVISTSAGALLLSVFLPADGFLLEDVPFTVLGAAVGAVAYGWINFRLVSLFVRVAYPNRSLGTWSTMPANHTTLAVLAVLGGLMGAAYHLVGPVILPGILVTYAVGHIGFAVHARLQQAYESTVRGFVKVIEALDPYTRGHTERVAHFCRITALELHLDPERRNRLHWAALIHDVGKLALPPSLLRTDGSLGEEEYRRAVRHIRVVDGVLAEVDFLRPMVAITADLHAVLGRLDAPHPPSLEGRILAASDAFDAMTSTRSYRAAVTQAAAFAALRADRDRFGGEIVEALITAIERRGEVYGSPDEESSAEVERLVKERSIRA